MIRGTRRQMIVLRTGGSRYFDTAYFILRERTDVGAAENDILCEANRIVSECAPARPEKSGTRRRAFLWGLLCGSLAAALLIAVPLLITAATHGWIF